MIIEDEGLNYLNELKLVSADKLVNEMKEECIKYSKLLELAKKDRIEVVKNLVSYTYYSNSMFESAWKWLSMLKEGANEETNCDERDSFKWVEDILGLKMFTNSLCIKSISFMDNEKHACIIDFNVEDSDITFQLIIPNIPTLSEEWWCRMHGGKLTLRYYQNIDNLEMIYESYKETEIHKAFIDFLSKHEYY